jgi:flagellar FliL protein
MAKDDEKEATEAKGGKKKLILMVAPVLILVVAAGWFLFLKPSSAGAATTLPDPKPGTIITMDSTTINLTDGHFLKFGLALQPTASAKTTDGSVAMDLAINEFSGMAMSQLSTAKGRNAAKAELLARIELAYLPDGKFTTAQTAAADQKVSGGKAKTDAELTAAQAIKRAAALTVQSDIYDIYFTEFVMQ